MFEANALARTVAVDWEASGYRAHAFVRVKVVGRPAVEVLEPLLRSDDVMTIAETTGCCDAVIAMLAADVADLRAHVVKQLRGHPAVAEAVTMVTTEVVKLGGNGASLPIPAWSPTSFPDPVVPLDELDVACLELLAVHGGQSNRELGRRLDVSDGTIRARIRRLEDAGLIRLWTVVDPVTTGEQTVTAFAFASVEGDDESLVTKLMGEPNVVAIHRVVGEVTLVLQIAGANVEEVSSYLNREFRAFDRVHSVEVAHVSQILRHQAHLQRFV
jgi:DNA-binding Lrp family transcriptional regulator